MRSTRVSDPVKSHRRRCRAALQRAVVVEALESRVLMTISLVSANLGGDAAGGAGLLSNPGTSAHFSRDGRFTLFTSTANNLVAGITDTNNAADLFLRNLQSGQTSIISVNASGVAFGSLSVSNAVFSPDSQYLVFKTGTANVVAGVADTNSNPDLFVRNLLTGVTSVVTINALGTSTGNASAMPELPVFSPDGQFMVFVSQASNLVAGITDTNAQDVFLRNMQTGAISFVSINAAGNASGLSLSEAPVISPDGRYIAFMSTSSTLVSGATDSNSSTDIFVRDVQTGHTTLITRDLTNHATGSGVSANPFTYRFTPDSQSLIFNSHGANMVAGVADTNGGNDIFKWNAQTNAISMLTVAPDGTTAGDKSSNPMDMSPDGRYVAFSSTSTNLTPQPADGDVKADLYVRDMETNTTTYVAFNATTSVAFPTPHFSPDGVHLLFQSSATNVAPGVADTNNLPDLFLYNVQSSVITAVTINMAGTATGNSQQFSVDDPVFSPDGRYLSFVSDATDIATGVTSNHLHRNIFVRDIQAGTTTLVTVGLNNTDAGYDQAATRDAEFSPNNRFLLFTYSSLYATAISTPFNFNFAHNLYAFDVVTKTQHLLSTNAAGTAPANGGVEQFSFALNPVGGSVLFISAASNMVAGVNDIPAGQVGSFDAFVATLPSANPATGSANAGVSGIAVPIVSGDATPSVSDNTDFGTTTVGTPVIHSFLVSNSGTSPLTTSNLVLPAGYTLVDSLDASIAAGGSDGFSVRFDATSAGTFAGNVSFNSNDSAAPTYTFAITAAATPGAGQIDQPDLVIEGGVTSVKAGTFVGGTKGGKAAAKVFNRGTATAAGSLQVTFYASADATVDGSDTLLVTITKKVTLKVGKNLAYPASFNYPLGVPDGQYYILAKVDTANAFAEQDENNNTAASPLTIGVAAPFIDFSGVSVTPTGKYKVGKQGNANLILHNGGNVKAAGSITLQLVLSTDDILGNSDDLLVTTVVKTVGIGAGKDKTFSLKANLAGVLAGSYHLFAMIDTTGAMAESNEGNNSLESAITVVVV